MLSYTYTENLRQAAHAAGQQDGHLVRVHREYPAIVSSYTIIIFVVGNQAFYHLATLGELQTVVAINRHTRYFGILYLHVIDNHRAPVIATYFNTHGIIIPGEVRDFIHIGIIGYRQCRYQCPSITLGVISYDTQRYIRSLGRDTAIPECKSRHRILAFGCTQILSVLIQSQRGERLAIISRHAIATTA